MPSTDSAEGQIFDKKSIRTFSDHPSKWDWSEIAKDCVAFANARGGDIFYGVENNAKEPSPSQKIPASVCDAYIKGVSNRTRNAFVTTKIEAHPNGGDYFCVHVLSSAKSIASTSDGRYYLRIADESKPMMPDDLVRLLPDKASFQWETQTSLKVPVNRADDKKLTAFLKGIRASDRVKDFIKNLDDDEIIENYSFAIDGFLSNLGILWIGRQQDRARLVYSPIVQFIKYDEGGEKVYKQSWDDYSLNPAELIEAIWTEIPEWKEYTELPDGLFRKQIPQYDEIIVRELLINALVHRPYTTGGDVFINHFPDHIEMRNPGRLPLGVSPQNILQKHVRRNELLAHVFHDLKLMEKEGSGYDRMYETQLLQGKEPPIVSEDDDSVSVRINRGVIKNDLISFLGAIDQKFELTSRERIAMGLIAQHTSLTALEFSKLLQLDGEDRLRNWISKLLSREIIISKGRSRGTEYFINPLILRSNGSHVSTTLKNIEKPRLRQLILSDLEIHGPDSSRATTRGDIHLRIGKDIALSKLRVALKELVNDGSIQSTQKRGRGGAYFLSKHMPDS
jgi:ATP-dependent DNA helicase RecG